MRRNGTLLIGVGVLIVLAGGAMIVHLLSRGQPIRGAAFKGIFAAWMALGFGWSGVNLLLEARALDYEAAHRPGPERPLRAPRPQSP